MKKARPVTPFLPERPDEQHLELIRLYTRAIAHALNNCLSGASGFQQLLAIQFQREDRPDAGKVREYLQEMEKSLFDTESLLQDLSRWAKSSPPSLSPLDLASAVRETADRFLDEHPEARDRFRLDIAEGLPPVPADEGLVNRCLDEILENAGRATEQNGGEIEFTLARDPGDRSSGAVQHLSVRDRGCGIEKERLPFFHLPLLATFRPDHSSPPGWNGRGFGLATAFECARSLGARMTVEPGPEGGTVVTLDLPEKRPEA